MTATLVLSLFVFGLGALCIGFWLKQSKIKLQLLESDQKRLQLESQLSHQPRQANVSKPQKPASVQGNPELLDLRREISQFKDETRRLKEELKSKETALKDSSKQKENELFHLTETNRALLAQLQESSRKKGTSEPSTTTQTPQVGSSEKANSQETKPSQIQAETEINQLKGLVKEREKWLQNEEKRRQELQHRIRDLEKDLVSFQTAAAENGGKPLDTAAFVRWKDRAIEGRKMYQMMKQLRDLSDQKLENYQKGLELLCKLWLADNRSLVPEGSAALTAEAVSPRNVDKLFALSLEVCALRAPEHPAPQTVLTLAEKSAPIPAEH